MSGATVAAGLSLAFGSVAAQDDEGSMEEMASMAPMTEMELSAFSTPILTSTIIPYHNIPLTNTLHVINDNIYVSN